MNTGYDDKITKKIKKDLSGCVKASIPNSQSPIQKMPSKFL